MAASIKCDERPFKGGVWGGFASEVYPPQQREAVQVVAKFFKPAKASNLKQKRAKASQRKPKQARAS